MTVALLLATAMQAQAAPPMIPAFFTGESLHQICRRPNSGQCSMYVAGVLDGLFYARSRGGGPALCSRPITNQEAAAVVTDFLGRNPEMRPHAAAVGVREALAERLDCDPPPTRTASRSGG